MEREDRRWKGKIEDEKGRKKMEREDRRWKGKIKDEK